MRHLLKFRRFMPHVVRHGTTVFDARAPRALRIASLLVIAYVLSPIDVVPDFIPLLGMVDDVTLVTVLVMAIAKFYVTLRQRQAARVPVPVGRVPRFD